MKNNNYFYKLKIVFDLSIICFYVNKKLLNGNINMDIEVKDDDSTIVITIIGDIEMMTIKNFKHKLLEIGENIDKDIEIDLSNVNYIDSSGVGVLISLLKLQKKKGKKLLINKVSSKVLNVLKLSSLSDVFNI